MKKVVMMILVFTMLVLTACGGGKSVESSEPDSKEKINKSDDVRETKGKNDGRVDSANISEILNDIKTDFESTISYLEDELLSTYDIIGDTYDGYLENKQYINDWYELVLSESERLFSDTNTKANQYYKAIAASANKNTEDTDSEIEKFKEDIYETTLDMYKNDLYETAFDELRDKYYDGVLKQAKDTSDYAKWLDVHTQCYSDWLDARTDVYGGWLDARTDLYSTWLDIKSNFRMGNFDVDSIISNSEPNETTTSEESTPSDTISPETTPTETPETTQETEAKAPATGIRLEFKEAMESYEEFFDEYVEFMKKYSSAEDTSGMLLDYAKYISKYAETMKDMEALDDGEMSNEEALYYAEVTTRISQKLLEVAGSME